MLHFESWVYSTLNVHNFRIRSKTSTTPRWHEIPGGIAISIPIVCREARCQIMSISINNHFDTLSKGKISLDIMLQSFKSWEHVFTTVISIIVILSIYDNIVIFAINPQLKQRNLLWNLKSNKKINHVIPLLVVTQSLSTNNINDLHSHDIIKFYMYTPI